MKIQSAHLAVCLLALVSLSLGCTPAEKPSTETAQPAETDSHAGHDHGHEDLGPHGGHLLHLSPSNGHAEWTHDDDNHLITVYLDEASADAIKEAKFVVKIGEESEEFPLEAGDDGWSITSETLLTHINMGEAADVQLIVVDDSGEQSSKIEAHEHHHH